MILFLAFNLPEFYLLAKWWNRWSSNNAEEVFIFSYFHLIYSGNMSEPSAQACWRPPRSRPPRVSEHVRLFSRWLLRNLTHQQLLYALLLFLSRSFMFLHFVYFCVLFPFAICSLTRVFFPVLCHLFSLHPSWLLFNDELQPPPHLFTIITTQKMSCMPRNWSTRPSARSWTTPSTTWLPCNSCSCFMHCVEPYDTPPCPELL